MNSLAIFVFLCFVTELGSSQECEADEWQCHDARQCVPLSYRCDSDPDCHDASDETRCEYHRCSADFWRCKDNHCIPDRWHCDGHQDCNDGSDEQLCEQHTCDTKSFRCRVHHCIPVSYRCDGYDDCADGSDEDNCGFPHDKIRSTTRLPTHTTPQPTLRPKKGRPYNRLKGTTPLPTSATIQPALRPTGEHSTVISLPEGSTRVTVGGTPVYLTWLVVGGSCAAVLLVTAAVVILAVRKCKEPRHQKPSSPHQEEDPHIYMDPDSIVSGSSLQTSPDAGRVATKAEKPCSSGYLTPSLDPKAKAYSGPPQNTGVYMNSRNVFHSEADGRNLHGDKTPSPREKANVYANSRSRFHSESDGLAHYTVPTSGQRSKVKLYMNIRSKLRPSTSESESPAPRSAQSPCPGSNSKLPVYTRRGSHAATQGLPLSSDPDEHGILDTMGESDLYLVPRVVMSSVVQASQSDQGECYAQTFCGECTEPAFPSELSDAASAKIYEVVI